MQISKVQLSFVFMALVTLSGAAALLLPSRSSFEQSSSSVAGATATHQAVSAPLGSYERVQQVFDHRCIECHSCNNAPCQLKLTSYEGFSRGMTNIQLNDTGRLAQIALTRLGIDAHSVPEWRKRGFVSVHEEGMSEANSTFMQVLKTAGNTNLPVVHVMDQLTCPMNPVGLHAYLQANPGNYMPYGLPALTDAERQAFTTWIAQGSRPTNDTPHRTLGSRAENPNRLGKFLKWFIGKFTAFGTLHLRASISRPYLIRWEHAQLQSFDPQPHGLRNGTERGCHPPTDRRSSGSHLLLLPAHYRDHRRKNSFDLPHG